MATRLDRHELQAIRRAFEPIYEYPDDDNADVKAIKRLAAKCGRNIRKPAWDGHFEKLQARLAELESHEVLWWARVVMIDHRWQGATGQGGYWAAASDACNRAAWRVLFSRGKLGFTLIEPGDTLPRQTPMGRYIEKLAARKAGRSPGARFEPSGGRKGGLKQLTLIGGMNPRGGLHD